MTKKETTKEHGNTKYPYKPEYADMIVEFFSPPHYITISTKDHGSTKFIKEALPPVFLSDFARSIGITRGYSQLFIRWAEKNEEFAVALNESKKLEVDRIRVNASLGLYHGSFSIFTLKNIAGWRDAQDIKHSGSLEFSLRGLVQDVNGNVARENKTGTGVD